MFIAHLPAGYCLTTFMLSRFVRSKDNRAYRHYFRIGMAASLLPDLDLIYFYLIDHCRHPHHAYLTHIPFYWLLVGLWIGSCGWLLRQRFIMWNTVIVIANVILHLVLDSATSKVFWLHPLSGAGLGLFQVPSRHGWWVWNFILHWTFGLEIMIVVAAICLLYYKNTSEHDHRICKGRSPSCG